MKTLIIINTILLTIMFIIIVFCLVALIYSAKKQAKAKKEMLKKWKK